MTDAVSKLKEDVAKLMKEGKNIFLPILVINLKSVVWFR